MGGGISIINVSGLLSNLVVIAGFLVLLVVLAVGSLWLLRLFRQRGRSKVLLKSIPQPLPTYRSTLPQFRKEISRARRLERPMTLVVMRPTSALSGWQKKTGMSSKIETKDSSYIHSYHLDTIRFWLSGCALRDALREIDVAAYDGANNQFVVALPESTEKQALLAVNRLNDIIGDRIATQLYIGVAEFPEDGLIMEDLIKHAMDPTNRELGAHNQAKDREPATRQKPSLLIPERERVGT